MTIRRNKGRVITAIIMMLTVVALLILTSCGDKPFYKDAVVESIYNGSRTAFIGEYSRVTVDKAEVTDEAIVDWYTNYVEKNDHNWDLIIYKDDPTHGVFTNGSGYVEKDCTITMNDIAEYMMDEEGTMYHIRDGKLVKG